MLRLNLLCSAIQIIGIARTVTPERLNVLHRNEFPPQAYSVDDYDN